MLDRDIEAERQVFMIAINLGVEKLRERWRNATDEEVADLYNALRIAPGKLTITVEMPTGKDLL